MGLARVASRAQLGLSAPRVEVEVHLGGGLPTFSIVGMAATAVRESKDRVRAALANSNFEWPAGRITVNLSPADLPKEGCRYDLPIALGILLASSQIQFAQETLSHREFYGELGLAGELKPVRGMVLAAAHAARESRGVIVPRTNLREARLAARDAQGAACLLEVCAAFATRRRGRAVRECLEHEDASVPAPALAGPLTDLADVRGHAAAKRALTIAAAGGHSLLMIGSPGAGKSMLAQRLPGLLPALDAHEALEVASIASVSSRGFEPAAFGQRPFRSPHHTASTAAIIGGGPHAGPGEVSLAHRGVLFLDELPHFNRGVLESLREPLETGVVAISRAALRLEYPARFQLIAAMNPCPCGYHGDPTGRCRCAPGEIERYGARLSGPLVDRIDLRVEVRALGSEELLSDRPCDSVNGTAQVAARVRDARRRQLERAGHLNIELTAAGLEEHCRLDAACRRLLSMARARLPMSARGIHRMLRVARTIADLEAAPGIGPGHLAEAMQLRRALETSREESAPPEPVRAPA